MTQDTRESLLAAFGGGACPAAPDGFINYVIDDYDIRLIGFDSSIPGKSGGEICDVRAVWLEEQLAVDSAEKPRHPHNHCAGY